MNQIKHLVVLSNKFETNINLDEKRYRDSLARDHSDDILIGL
jgi:hypothetical protein